MMKNIENAKNEGILTEMESVLIQYLLESGFYAEKYFSDVDIEEVASGTKYTINQVKGIVGSLTKKGYLFTEFVNGYHIVCATDKCYKLDDDYEERWGDY